MKTDTRQDGWEGWEAILAGQMAAAGGIFRKIFEYKVITQYLFLLAVTLLKVTGQKNPEKSQERKGQESLGNLEKGGTSSDSKAEYCASPQSGEVFNPSYLSCHHTNRHQGCCHNILRWKQSGEGLRMHLGVVDSHLSPVIVEAALLLPCSLPLLTRDSSSDRSWLCGQGVLSWANCPWPTAGSITGNTGNINSNPGNHVD